MCLMQPVQCRFLVEMRISNSIAYTDEFVMYLKFILVSDPAWEKKELVISWWSNLVNGGQKK